MTGYRRSYSDLLAEADVGADAGAEAVAAAGAAVEALDLAEVSLELSPDELAAGLALP